MNDLERRYLWLLRAYPAEYRRSRGAEVVGTYLDLAAPGRRWPSPADAADLVRGGLRQRLRAAGAVDLIPGVRLAALLALLTASALAGVWTVLELRPAPPGFGEPSAGPFVSLGIVAWAAWLLAAAVHALAPERWTRSAVGLALFLTVALVPAAAFTGLPRPPLFVLLPQIGLGLVALGASDRPPAPLRAVPLVVGGAAGLAGTNLLPRNMFAWTYYVTWTVTPVLTVAAVVLLALVVLLGAGLALRGDHRGGWATLILLTPVGLLALHPLAEATDGLSPAFNPSWVSLATTAVLVTLVGSALLPLTLALRPRPRNHPGRLPR